MTRTHSHSAEGGATDEKGGVSPAPSPAWIPFRRVGPPMDGECA